MATEIVKLVAPTGGDYTLLSTAIAAIPTDLVAADENWLIEIETFSGGLADGVTVPAITCDATRHITIRALTGHEYVAETGVGAYIVGAQNFGGIIKSTAGTDFLLVEDLGAVNTGTNSPRAWQLENGNDVKLHRLYGEAVSDLTPAQAVFRIATAVDVEILNCLAFGEKYGFQTANGVSGVITNCTAIDPDTSGYNRGNSNNTVVHTNCLHIGGGTWGTSGANPFLGDYNATDDTTVPVGANSLANRSTGDLVNYAGGDYRTAEGSALATAGDATKQVYIGYAVEPTVSSYNTFWTTNYSGVI